MAVERVGTQSIGPSLSSVYAIQGHDFQVNNSTINVAGGDQHHHAHAHSHTHIHYHEITDKLKAALDAVSNYRKTQQDTLAKATPGTIIWLFKCKEFRLFVDVDGTLKILWGSGMPGAGKTILASIVINELERIARESNGQICVGYVYIRYSDQDQVTIQGILESLVKQTIERHPDCVSLAQQAYNSHIREGTRPTEDELLHLLGQFSRKKKATFYILDALDEAPPMIRLKLVKKLSSLGVRLFITSRPLPALEAKFPDVHPFHIAAQDHDLDLHIDAKISESQELQDLLEQSNPTLKEQLISRVKSNCGGMFLHASLQLDALQHCFTAHDAIQTLDDFPRKIEDVYHQTWIRIVGPELPRHAPLAKEAFAWVLKAKQSMTIDLLRHALATCPETHHYEPAKLMPEATILAACRGLIIVDKESRLTRLVHYTAKEPLERLLSNVYPNPHSLLTAVCITRLADCGFQNSSIASDKELDQALRADSLLGYAHEAWAFHAQNCIHLEPTTSLVTTFVAGCGAFPVLLPGNLPTLGRMDYNWDVLASLHMVAFYNLPLTFAGRQATHNPNILTGRLRMTALHLTCFKGHEAVAQSLLCLPGILVNAKNAHGATPLMIACMEGYEGVVALFVTRPDLEINGRDNEGFTALMFALGRVVKLVLDCPNLDVNIANWLGAVVSIPAVAHGHIKVVELLLTVPGIDVNAVDGAGTSNTAIKLAAWSGQEDIVRRLLDVPGIDISIAGVIQGRRHTAMSAALADRRHGIVRLLQDFEAKRTRTARRSLDRVGHPEPVYPERAQGL